MNIFERSIRKIDVFQQEHKATSFIFGVIKKYGDDNGGNLAVQLTYSAFVTIFPLVLLLITILTLVLASDPSLKRHVINSTFSEFPLVGSQLGSNIHVLRKDSIFGLVVSLLFLIYGATGLAGSGIYIMEQVWNIEGPKRPNFANRKIRGLIFLCVLGFGLLITTFLSGFGTFGRHNIVLSILSEILALAANIAIYLAVFRVLTPKVARHKDLIPGAIFGGIAWTILQALGGFIVGHYLRNDNATYGVFGTVLGLIAWIYLGVQVMVYAAEINVTLKRRLWPRSMIQPPLSKADQESIAYQAVENRRRPEQQVTTKVMGKPTTQKQYLKNKGTVNTKTVGTIKRSPAKKH